MQIGVATIVIELTRVFTLEWNLIYWEIRDMGYIATCSQVTSEYLVEIKELDRPTPLKNKNSCKFLFLLEVWIYLLIRVREEEALTDLYQRHLMWNI